MMKKIMGWVTIFLLMGAPSFAQSLSELYQQEKALDKQIVQAFRFRLDPEQPRLGGMNEKFLVRDQLNRRWLFKTHQSKDLDVISDVAYNVSKYVGVTVPRTYIHTFKINGQSIQGTLLQWVDGAIDMKKIPANQFSNVQLGQLFKQQVLDYLLVNFDVRADNFLYQEESSEVWGIDKDFSFDYWGESMPLNLNPKPGTIYWEDYYIQAWKSYIQTPKQVEWGILLQLVDYIDTLDTAFLSELVAPAFKLSRVKKYVGSMKDYLKRHENMRKEFFQFYTEVLIEKGKGGDFPSFPPATLYASLMKDKAIKRIEAKKEELKTLKSKGGAGQVPFTLIKSRKAWQFVLDNESKGPQFLVPGLKKILSQTRDPNEKRAVELYIKQVSSWNPKNQRDWDFEYVVGFPKN